MKKRIIGLLFVMMLMIIRIQSVNAAGQITITNTTIRPNEKIETTISEQGNYTYNWYVGDNLTDQHESYYIPKTSEYENWIRVEIIDSQGTAVDSDEVYYSKLPVVYITTDDGSSEIEHDVYKSAQMLIQGNSEYNSQYDGAISIKGRGNSTWTYIKKPYKIKLDASTDLFGLGKNKHWVLLANYIDESMMRNQIASDLSEHVGMVTMSSTYVDVVMNGNYIGCYQLCEHIRVGETRVNIFDYSEMTSDIAKAIYKANGISKLQRDEINDLLDTDLSWLETNQITYNGITYKISDYYSVDPNIYTGGYLFELSSEYDSISQFMTSSGLKVMIDTPEYACTNQTMMNYIQNMWQNFDDAIHSIDGYDSNGTHYTQMVDVDSMVDYFLVNEVMGNIDVYQKSRYVYKEINGLLTFGPVWDFDWAAASSKIAYAPDKWSIRNAENRNYDQNFMAEVINDPYFMIRAEEEYWKMHDYLLTITSDGGMIDSYYAQLKEAGTANSSMWYFARGFDGDVQILKQYFTDRIAWLDQQFADEDSIIESINATVGEHPYKASDAVTIAYKNAVTDSISTVRAAGGLIGLNTDLKMTVAVNDTATTKVYVAVNGIALNTYSLKDGKVTLTVPAKYFTEETGMKNVISIIGYNSSNEATCINYRTIIVSDQTPKQKSISTISFADSSYSVAAGSSKQLNITVSDCNSDPTIIYTSSNPEIASVNAKGIVTAYKEGTVTINALASNGITNTACKITVFQFPFTDVPEGKWYYEYIAQVYQKGLMTGTTSTTFKPYENMTRGMVATVLYRMAGQPETVYTDCFEDVASGKYYSEAISWCYANGIVTGYGDGTFKPSNQITRQEFVLMLYRYACYAKGKKLSANGDLSKFADVSNVSSYATEAMKWAVEQGVITGKTENGQLCIDPKSNATRAECAKMLLVAYESIQ